MPKRAQLPHHFAHELAHEGGEHRMTSDWRQDLHLQSGKTAVQLLHLRGEIMLKVISIRQKERQKAEMGDSLLNNFSGHIL